MTTLEVTVISKEIIKPSSPTPDHLRHYRYSFLDQTSLPQIYSSMVLFFQFNGQTLRPEFISATLFPTKLFTQTCIGVAKNKLVTKRFVFDASNIEYLRARYVGTTMKRPSRVEALSAFIWSRFVAISKDDGIHEKLHGVIHVVNLRPRFDPPLPLHSFGNLISFACSTPSLLNTREECYGLARQVREAICKIDKGYIKKLQGGADHDNMTSSDGGEKVTSFFTGLCKFPLYDNDFGWGKPSWVYVRLPGLNFNNLVIFIETKDNNGIEAYITSAEEVLTKLQRDTEFLQRVYPSWICSSPSLTHQPSPFAELQCRNRQSLIKKPSVLTFKKKKPSVLTKPVTWGAGSVRLFGLAVRVLKMK